MTEKSTMHVHLVSDATGETNYQVTRACIAQFENLRAHEHVWSLVRTTAHIEKILASVAENPGPVLFTLLDPLMRQQLEDGCWALQIPCLSILDPVTKALSNYLGVKVGHIRPGGQHELDKAYFERIEAMNYTISHDDGQMVESLYEADIVLVGVSRTSKTPTSLYLANRGYKTANIPMVPNIDLPAELFAADEAFIVGLTNDPDRLIQIRQNRILMLNQTEQTDYIDIEYVKREVQAARRLFRKYAWPEIDVTRRSIEETAAAVLQKFQQRKEAILVT